MVRKMCPSCSSLFRVTTLQVKTVNALDLISEVVMVITCYWGELQFSSYCIPFHSVFNDFGTPLNMICQRLFDWFSDFFENRSYVSESVLRFL